MTNRRKIPIRNFNNELSCIIKVRLDKKGISTWKELTDMIGIENQRTFIDFFNGKQCVKKEHIDKLFEILEIDNKLKEIYLEPVVKYKIKGSD